MNALLSVTDHSPRYGIKTAVLGAFVRAAMASAAVLCRMPMSPMYTAKRIWWVAAPRVPV
ncbi:MAG: hypothetical protein KTR20_00245 [Cellvibrionaceae bacterium]|nr:hypothetical protein [Cellvibrionaceae bacterium]